MGHRDYLAATRIPALDGLRAVAILLVLTWHVNSTVWHRLQGWEGVTLFFVLSGFLITRLLLRERDTTGRVDLWAFYRRRRWRILPAYLTVLAVYGVLVIGLDWHHHRGLLLNALPWYFGMNDFTPFVRDTPFAQSWSLGVEEKFYLVWPVLIVVLAGRRRSVLTGVSVAAALLPFLLLPLGVFGWTYAYADIAVGCLLAIALHDARGYRLATRYCRLWPSLAALVALWALIGVGRPVEYLFPFAVAAVMVPLVTCPARVGARLLAGGRMRTMGRLSYSVYLVHMLVASVVITTARKAGLWMGPTGLPHGIVANILVLAAVAAGSFVVAEGLWRTVERPLNRYGHRRRERRQPAPAAVTRSPHARRAAA